jgi:hypothetical protein
MLFRSAFNSLFLGLLKSRNAPAALRRSGDYTSPAPSQARCGEFLRSPALLLASLSVAASGVYGQPDMPVELKHLPVWPGSAAAAKSFADQHVFRDQSGEIVVSYPDPSDPASSVTFRFWLQNRVVPQISVALKHSSDGRFTYDYTLRNGPAAKTGIWAWSVVAPPSKELAVSHPVWYGSNSFESVVAPQALLRSAGVGVYLRWTDESNPVAPGGQLSGFEIVSRLRPGLTTAYFSGKEAPIRAPTELTEDVEEQIIPLERAPVMYKAALTIGPRFAAEVNARSILLAYQADIRDLVNSGFLNKSSPFIKEVEQALARAIASDRRSIETPKELPQAHIEKELLGALELALRPR